MCKGYKDIPPNINELMWKKDSVGILLKAVHCKIDIFGLNETHSHKDTISSEVNIQGYNFERETDKSV